MTTAGEDLFLVVQEFNRGICQGFPNCSGQLVQSNIVAFPLTFIARDLLKTKKSANHFLKKMDLKRIFM